MKTPSFMIAAGLALCLSACMNNGQPTNSGTTPATPTDAGANKPDSQLQGNAFTISTTTYYQGGQAAISSPGRIVSLTLAPDGYAKMVMENQDNTQVTTDTGVWMTNRAGNLMLRLKRIAAPDTPRLEFRPDGQKLIYTGTMFGADGLVLMTKPTPASEVR